MESAPIASDECFWNRDGANRLSTPLPIRLKSLMLCWSIVGRGKTDIAASVPTIKCFCKSPEHSHALKDNSYDVERGRVTTLPGASGSGTSTFLRCLNEENGQ